MSSFVTSIRKFRGTIEDATVLLQKRVAFDLLRFTVKKTSVKTGLLRANWNLGLNRPVKDVRGKVVKGKAVGARGGIGLANSNVASLKLGDTIFLNNPVKYAPYVEFGTPSTPPRAMLSRSIEEVRNKYK